MRPWNVALSPAIFAALLTTAAAAPASADAGSRGTTPPTAHTCASQIGKLEFAPPTAMSSRFAAFSAMITITCAPDTAFKLRLTSANGCKLRSGARTLNYRIFLDAAATNALLDCGPTKLEYTGKGSTVLMVYGRTSLLPTFYGNAAAVAEGHYSDDIDVELESF